MSPRTTRRTFLALSGAALAASKLGVLTAGSADAAQAGAGSAGGGERLFAYVGRRTRGGAPGGFTLPPDRLAALNGQSPNGGGGISVFRVNLADGALTPVSATGPEVDDLNCDGMCTSADGRFLYAVNQVAALGGKPGTGGGVSAFAINRQDGSLRFLNTVPSLGANPTGVIIDKTNSRVLVANHGAAYVVAAVTKRNGVPVVEPQADDGTVALYAVKPDGSLEPAMDVSVFTRRGLNEPGPGAAAHQVIFDRSERWAIASDNGFNHLYVYRVSPTAKVLEGKSYPTPGDRAPRHLVYHPTAPFFFFTNEREASVSSYAFDANTGVPKEVQTIATIPADYTGPRVAPSNIRLHPGGRWLYASNRAVDTVAIFSVDDKTGRLTAAGTVKTGGRNPREMGIEPSGRYLHVCNQGTGDVTTFAIDAATGGLTQKSQVQLAQAGVISFARL